MTEANYCDIYRRFKHRLVRYANTILADAYLAEDVAQETLLSAALRLPPEMPDPWPWLRKVARNQCIDLIRASREQPDWRFLELVGTESAESEAQRREMITAVKRAFDDLPSSHREALQLSYWEDLSYEEIAQRQGISRESVRDRLHYAKVLLHAKLKGWRHLGWLVFPRLGFKKALTVRSLKVGIRLAVISAVSITTISTLVPQTSSPAAEALARRSRIPGYTYSPVPIQTSSLWEMDNPAPHEFAFVRPFSHSVGGATLPRNGGTDVPGSTSGTIGPVSVDCDPQKTGPLITIACTLLSARGS